jgi:6-phosphogluconolactonase
MITSHNTSHLQIIKFKKFIALSIVLPLSSFLTLTVIVTTAFKMSASYFSGRADYKVGDKPYSVSYSPDGKSLAVANSGSGNVHVFRVNHNGTLTPFEQSPFEVGGEPIALAYSPDGYYLAIANRFTKISVVRIDSHYGQLFPVKGYRLEDSSFSTGKLIKPYWLAYSPNGKYLATTNIDTVANPPLASVSVFKVEDGGKLTQMEGSPFCTGERTNGPCSIAFSPNGLHLATANYLSHTVSMFRISNGILTRVAGSPFSTGKRSGVRALAFSPNGLYLATADHTISRVSVFAVNNETGALTPLSKSPFHSKDPFTVTYSPDSSSLVVTNYLDADFDTPSSISLYTVGLEGNLIPIEGSPFSTGLPSSPTATAYSSSGSHLAITSRSGTVSILSIASLSNPPGYPHGKQCDINFIQSKIKNMKKLAELVNRWNTDNAGEIHTPGLRQYTQDLCDGQKEIHNLIHGLKICGTPESQIIDMYEEQEAMRKFFEEHHSNYIINKYHPQGHCSPS